MQQKPFVMYGWTDDDDGPTRPAKTKDPAKPKPKPPATTYPVHRTQAMIYKMYERKIYELNTNVPAPADEIRRCKIIMLDIKINHRARMIAMINGLLADRDPGMFLSQLQRQHIADGLPHGFPRYTPEETRSKIAAYREECIAKKAPSERTKTDEYVIKLADLALADADPGLFIESVETDIHNVKASDDERALRVSLEQRRADYTQRNNDNEATKIQLERELSSAAATGTSIATTIERITGMLGNIYLQRE